VLGALAGLNVLLLVGLGPQPAWLDASKGFSLKRFEYLGGRVAAVVKSRRGARREGKAQKPLAVILGQSSVWIDVDSAVLEAHDGSACRWLQWAGLGGHMPQILFYTRPLLVSGLRPKLIVAGLHFFWMAEEYPREKKESQAAVGDAWEAFLSGNWKSVRHRTKRWFWVTYNRKYISKTLRLDFLRARRGIFGRIGLDVVARFAPVPDPWRGDEPPAWKSKHASKGEIKRQLRKFEKRGWFDARHYDPRGEASRLLIGLLRELHRFAQGAKGHGKLVIVLMPERAMMRARVPPKAEGCLKKIMEEAFSSEAPPVLNLRDLMPDAYFFDLVHLNKRGRLAFSKQLAAKLGAYLAPGPSNGKQRP